MDTVSADTLAYSQLLERLYQTNLFGGVKLGLANMEALMSALGNPEREFPAVHIAGTNGKGTLAWRLAAALRASGKKVGLYTSPHISSFRERILVNGEMIPVSAVERLLPQLFDIPVPSTYFELTTALALAYFAEQEVDVAVIEVGLGGRLDATNVVQSELTVITSIALDHCGILGNSLEEIAAEKAGIFKPGVPALIGPRVPRDPGWDCVMVGGEGDENDLLYLKAAEMLRITGAALDTGYSARPPCRFQEMDRCGRRIVLDVAHNPDGIERLARLMSEQYPGKSIEILAAFSQDKDVDACLDRLYALSENVTLVSAEHERLLSGKGFEPVGPALERAFAFPKAEVLLVCGSFFIMSDVLAYLELHS